ncbi:MAG: peptidylprolyl isomerase [Bacteroidota bacterium]|nr:peptidylprolyl isomerase [Bacteroidota bacterium]
MTKVKDNDKVKVHYTGKFKDGQVFDSSLEREPLEFEVGKGQMIPGFEKAVVGMEKGEKKEINLSPDEGYGEKREELTQEVNKDQLPEDLEPKVGMQLQSRTPDGNEFRVTVAEIKDDSILIDANHPLAGKELVFEIELVDIA